MPEHMSSAQSDSELNDYVRVIRLRKWWIIGVLLLMLGAGFAYTRTRTPLYTSTAHVLVAPTSTAGAPQTGTGVGAATIPLNMETEQSVATSPQAGEFAEPYLDRGGKRIDALLKDLSVSVEAGTEILIFEYSAENPEVAMSRAQAFAQGYLDLKRDQRLGYLIDAERALKRQIRRADDQVTISSLEQTLAQLRAASTLASRPGEIVKSAELPSDPSSPSYPRNLALAGLLGLGLGIAAAFVRERLDDRFRDPAILQPYTNAPVLAVVPRTRRFRSKNPDDQIISLSDPMSPAADAFRALRAGVIYLHADLPPGISKMKILMVASARPEEGKSTISANLAVALARAQKSVILVDADLRRPRLGALLESETKLGLANVLSGEVDLEQVLVKTKLPSLRFLDTGAPGKNAWELLETPAMAGTIDRLNGLADYVIIDTPPVLTSPDAITVAPLVDGVLLIAASNQTKIRSLRETVRQLETVGAVIVGSVLNMHKPSGASKYSGASYTYLRRSAG